MERIFSQKEFLHITEWYTFQELKDMTGFRTESICDIIKTNKIPKKKTNNCVYVSNKHWDEARGNHLNLEEEYYTMKQISAKYGLLQLPILFSPGPRLTEHDFYNHMGSAKYNNNDTDTHTAIIDELRTISEEYFKATK